MQLWLRLLWAVCVGLFFFLCVEVNGCIGTTSWVVLRVVFEFLFVFFGLFGCGFGGFVSLVCMALCWFFWVVVVGAC